MTKEQIEKKALEAYPEKRIKETICGEDYKIDTNTAPRDGYIKALTEIEELPKIKGWVARDSTNDPMIGTGLIFHSKKPRRLVGEWGNPTIEMHLPWDMFPDLKWEDEPLEVELIIRPYSKKQQEI